MPATFTPTPRFRKDATGRVRLLYGDVTFLALETGRTPGHISRVLGGERASDALRAEIERIVGASVDVIDLPRKRAA
ncbi:MAG: hypothetical protein C0499_02650 [Zymomonas sp.]|nr:hypothetical protein [Zymomonas sp.]